MTLFKRPVAETWAKAAFACALIASRASTLLTDLLMPRAPEHRKPSLECIDRGLVEALLLEKGYVPERP